MAYINSQGFVDDGSSDLSVAGNVSIDGTMTVAGVVTLVSGAVTSESFVDVTVSNTASIAHATIDSMSATKAALGTATVTTVVAGTLSGTLVALGTANVTTLLANTISGTNVALGTTTVTSASFSSASFGSVSFNPTKISNVGWTTVPGPGFFVASVSAAGFTGSLPTASYYPGSTVTVTDAVGLFSYKLVASAVSMMSASGASIVSKNGTTLAMSAGGTVSVLSDGKGWLVHAVSGTLSVS